MSASTIADRYAKSLMETCVEQNNVETIYNDVKGLKTTFENKDISMLLKSPIINATKKLNVMNSIYSGKVDGLTLNFLSLVVKKGREAYLPQMCDAFINQYREKNNIASAKVITATKLTEEKLNSIKASLNLQATSFEIEEEVDESLIGGFIIEMGDKRYDASVKHKLNKLRKSIT